jgi:hypothetical protein
MAKMKEITGTRQGGNIKVQVVFNKEGFERFKKKVERSGLDMSSYIKLVVAKVDIEYMADHVLVGDQRARRRVFKKETKGLEVAEGHALRALGGSYDAILAVNELWIFNRGWVRALVRQYEDKYGEFSMSKTSAKTIIKGYFEIEDIVERPRGSTRGRYRLRPEEVGSVTKLERRIFREDWKELTKFIDDKDNKDGHVQKSDEQKESVPVSGAGVQA